MAILVKDQENIEGTNDSELLTPVDKEKAKSPLRQRLESWLNKNMKIEMTDGRVLIGIFLCTDRDRNVILGSCAEYLQTESDESGEEPRVLGLAMVPGHHIVSIEVDSDLASNVEVL
ncbi:n-alpha-acetyltransferase 38, NatC auxiliary subunit [Trichonephila inaurata madagascariensis]|uniref:N-alpha-acetyltransferase 38, NatC auxiliary subunit n=1 Tax=Trichonephila inaurata madagascariensis TaxID=2747483 RepID=A0A8X6XC13_9ARAC|nr:n-alpha-acetyltransferase 38, NatC auxiliary subunit [Trichonephila inaurata madagascariensis]